MGLEPRCRQLLDVTMRMCRPTLHIGSSQCMYCMQPPRRSKPTISLRLSAPLLEEIDGLVRRTRMRSRTEFIERAIATFVDELKESRIVVVRPWTQAKARAAILRYLKGRQATYVTDIAEALGMDLDLAFQVAASLAKEGKVVG